MSYLLMINQFKMKKIIFLATFILSLHSYSQITAITGEQYVMPCNWSAYLDLNDGYFGDVTFKEGSCLVVEIIWVSEEEYNMRRIRYGSMNDWGIASEREEHEGSSFWRGMGEQVEDWVPNYTSKGLFYQGGGNNKYKFHKVYEAKISDPQAFLKAFKPG
jgi:hypothetical protein